MTRNRNPAYNSSLYRRRKKEFFASVAPVCAWPDCEFPEKRVDMRLSGNDMAGPTVDHVVPTSRGGDFWGPWALLHRICNLLKGDRPMPLVAKAGAAEGPTAGVWCDTCKVSGDGEAFHVRRRW